MFAYLFVCLFFVFGSAKNMHQDVGRGAVIFFREGEGRIGTSDWSLQIESKKSKHG